MIAEVGTAAAASKSTPAGFVANISAAPRQYSAKVPPLPTPNTSSPGAKRVTPAPTAATVPAASQPRTRSFGRRRPKPISRIMYGSPVIRCHTLGSSPAARTRTTISPAPGSGRATSACRSTPAGP